MSFEPGTRLGVYEIVSGLGAGGMGEVYRARDMRLERHVALKLVIEAFVADSDRAMRFEREAKTLAALNHPNIATLHGLEQADGRHFLVMELVDGETLAERIARHPGGLPLEDALRIGCQITEALEAAHDKGIVHRDLKPANVKITPDDKVKVLDFGLARVTERDATSSSSNLAHSPTMTSPAMTNAGVILGTASYMSPEQARGYAADHRSDIFSFGVVLYEMLTGRQPFPGDTISDVLASVLAREPDLSALPADLSPRLIELVKRCLEKNPKKRWQAIGDVRYELESLQTNPRAVVTAPATTAVVLRPLWRRALPFAAGAFAATLVVGTAAWITHPAPAQRAIAQFTIDAPELTVMTGSGAGANSVAVSPDGSAIAYAISRQIYVRRVAELEPKVVYSNPARSAIRNITFAPDSQSLAFWTADTWMRIPTSGGSPTTVAAGTTASVGGASWSGAFIVFAADGKILRVAASGGSPETLIEATANETPMRPQLLPDGQTVLFTVFPREGTDRWERGAVVAQRIGATARTKIVEPAADARFVAPGYLLFMRADSLFAAPFDASRLSIADSPAPVLDGIRRINGIAQFAVVPDGMLAYVPGQADMTEGPQRLIAVADPSGGKAVERLKIAAGNYSAPRVSPDGGRLAYVNADRGEESIWVYDLDGSGAPRRLTFGGRDAFPVWSPDGRSITFGSERNGETAIYRQPADGSGAAERLTAPEKGVAPLPYSWSPDGRVLLFDSGKDRVFTLMMLRADKTVAQFGGVQGRSPAQAIFSPDGRWVAYSRHVEATDDNAVFVQPFPATGALYQVSKSSEDGHHPVWIAGGKELVYNPGPVQPLQALRVTMSPAFTTTEARALQFDFLNSAPIAPRTYDAAPGGRIITLVPRGTIGENAPSTIRVVVNWIEELKAKVPAR